MMSAVFIRNAITAIKSKLVVRSTISSSVSTTSSRLLTTPSLSLARQQQQRCLQWNNFNTKEQPPRFVRRSKSSITTPLYPPSSSSLLHEEVYERAVQNALAFDAANDLHDDSWRQTQKQYTLLNPMKPYPRLLSQRKIISSSHSNNPDYFPSYATTGQVGPSAYPIDTVILHDEISITKLRVAGKLARQLLDTICNPVIAIAGSTTESIDTILHHTVLKYNAYPSPLNYAGFPKSVCTSVNEVICHGIPDSRPLCHGDVVSFDVSVYVDGVHGDNCATIIVGDQDESRGEEDERDANCYTKYGRGSPPQRTMFHSPIEKQRFITARRLVQAAYECRHEGIMACSRKAACLSDIGLAIHAVADAYGYDTVKHYRGHGIGTDFHCAPFVKHFRNDDRLELQSGMVFTIEPMITEGKQDCEEWDDDWTVVTKDGGRAAQFEHTVLITDNGVEIFTLP